MREVLKRIVEAKKQLRGEVSISNILKKKKRKYTQRMKKYKNVITDIFSLTDEWIFKSHLRASALYPHWVEASSLPRG